MADPFIGEIRALPYTYAPRDWAYCNGQLVEISQNTALYSIIGTTYGGDGRVTMGLPNLQGRIPIHSGTGPGIQYVGLGQLGGAPVVTLTASQIPSHVHNITVLLDAERETTPAGNLFPSIIPGNSFYKTGFTSTVEMSTSSIGVSGNSAMHENRQPFLAMSYCIAMDGIYPSRN